MLDGNRDDSLEVKRGFGQKKRPEGAEGRKDGWREEGEQRKDIKDNNHARHHTASTPDTFMCNPDILRSCYNSILQMRKLRLGEVKQFPWVTGIPWRARICTVIIKGDRLLVGYIIVFKFSTDKHPLLPSPKDSHCRTLAAPPAKVTLWTGDKTGIEEFLLWLSSYESD